MMRTMLARLRSERGSVGVVVALVMFVVMGMLLMTWNTAQVSKEKMRLQNAVDSAALSHAIWQARGMNAIQNMNEEKYLALDLAITLGNIGYGVEIAAQVAWTAALAVPFPIARAALKAVAWGLRVVGYATACTSGYLAHGVCTVLDVFQTIYRWCPVAGLVDAENYAYYNGASSLAAVNLPTFIGASIQFSASAIPITRPMKHLAMLPVEQKAQTAKPWKYDKDRSGTFKGGTFTTGAGVYRLFKAGQPWNVQPFVSTTSSSNTVELPPPVVWLAAKVGGHVEAQPLVKVLGEGYDDVRNMPILALGAGQCITGDVVPHIDNAKAPQRPLGFGCGATAKLVPVADAMQATVGNLAGTIFNAMVFH